jgi:HAD superfamily hydrolase (TIGR01509 family)
MDGTLVDSEPNYFKADQGFLAGYGIHYGEEDRDHMIGRGSVEFFRIMSERYPDNRLNDLPLAERLRLKDENYLAYASSHTFAFPEMTRLLRELSARGLPLAVASGSSQKVIAASLSSAGLSDYFTVTVSAEEVARGKPEPDIFLEAARRLGMEPEDCAVFEDSQYGITAARRASMFTVGVPSPVAGPMPAAFNGADLLFPTGMREFTAEALLARLGDQLGAPETVDASFPSC